MGAHFLKYSTMPENYTLSDKINVMMAKKKDAEIMVRSHNGTEQWTTIENPDFNWGVADYKVKPDYKLLFDKFQAAFVYDELYAAVHAQERGQNLPNIIDELSNQLATYKTSVLNKVENELLVGTSPLLSLTEFKKSIPGKTLAGILQKKLELEGKSKEEIETELEKGLITYLAELNSVIKTNLSTIRSSIKDQLALTLDKQILDIKALEENDLIKKEYTTKNKLKSIIINLFLEAVEKFFKDETEKYIFCKNGNFGITITRNTDKNNPTIQFFYLAYNKIDGFNDVPAIDWTLNADKVVTVSNITVQQLKDLQNSVDESKHICKTNYDNLKARVDLEIQNNIAKSEKIKELEQEISKLKENINDSENMPYNPICAYDMVDIDNIDKILPDFTGNNYHFKIIGNAKTVRTEIGVALNNSECSLSRKKQDFIAVGKQWTHSRWLKLDVDQVLGRQPSQEEEDNIVFVWNYGKIDNATLDIGYINEDEEHPREYGYFAINCKGEGKEYLSFFDLEEFDFSKWHHLVVMTDLHPTYCKKTVFIDGKKYGECRKTGEFSSNDISAEWTEYSSIEDGSIANLIFFNRLLTDSEVLWLYKNPVYLVKNYTAADAKLNKKLISLYKNGYIQWPGMPSPLEDANLQFEGYSWYKVNYSGNFFRAERRNAGVFSTKKLAKEQIKSGDYIFKDDEQEDAIRNIKGRLGVEGGKNSSGPFYNELNSPVEVESWSTASSSYRENAINFDLTKADGVNVAEENRPRNLTFIIWALVKD